MNPLIPNSAVSWSHCQVRVIEWHHNQREHHILMFRIRIVLKSKQLHTSLSGLWGTSNIDICWKKNWLPQLQDLRINNSRPQMCPMHSSEKTWLCLKAQAILQSTNRLSELPWKTLSIFKYMAEKKKKIKGTTIQGRWRVESERRKPSFISVTDFPHQTPTRGGISASAPAPLPASASSPWRGRSPAAWRAAPHTGAAAGPWCHLAEPPRSRPPPPAGSRPAAAGWTARETPVAKAAPKGGEAAFPPSNQTKKKQGGNIHGDVCGSRAAFEIFFELFNIFF